MNHFMSAHTGVDIKDGAGTYTPPDQVSWKGFVVLADTVVAAITDSGDRPSTGITSMTLPLGTVVSANGHFTSIQLTSGSIELIRG